jgi:hypothetical protein
MYNYIMRKNGMVQITPIKGGSFAGGIHHVHHLETGAGFFDDVGHFFTKTIPK